MQVARVRLIDLEHIVLATILDEIVGAIGQPAVKNRFVAVVESAMPITNCCFTQVS